VKKRLALVLGRQGSGKTTRVCAQAEVYYGGAIGRRPLSENNCNVKVIPNFYNHVSLSDNGDVFLITGAANGKAAHKLEYVLNSERTILELPHSGWLPKGINSKFNTSELQTKAFVLMLIEETWRSFQGEVGVILTPELWMSQGPQVAKREHINYHADCSRIRKEITQSGIPASHFFNAEQMIQEIFHYLA
jgi:hypothetical protein